MRTDWAHMCLPILLRVASNLKIKPAWGVTIWQENRTNEILHEKLA